MCIKLTALSFKTVLPKISHISLGELQAKAFLNMEHLALV